MKAQTDTTYTLVLNSKEDPTNLAFSTITDQNGNPIVPRTYEFAVSAFNWVGEGPRSQPLEVEIPYKVS